jgi:hypothetical protein
MYFIYLIQEKKIKLKLANEECLEVLTGYYEIYSDLCTTHEISEPFLR